MHDAPGSPDLSEWGDDLGSGGAVVVAVVAVVVVMTVMVVAVVAVAGAAVAVGSNECHQPL